MPEDVCGHRTIRAPTFTDLLEILGGWHVVQAECLSHRHLEGAVANRPNIRAIEAAHEKHVGGPWTDTRDRSESAPHVVIGLLSELIEVEPTVEDSGGDLPGVPGLLPAEADRAELVVGQAHDASGFNSGCHIFEAVKRGPRGVQGDLLFEDQQHKCREGRRTRERGRLTVHIDDVQQLRVSSRELIERRLGFSAHCGESCIYATGKVAAMATQLFITCLVDAFAPQVGRAAVGVIEAAGEVVEFPVDQSCCGQPAFNAGYTEDARAMAAHTVKVLDATEGPIVIPSGSCAEMIIHHFPFLLSAGPHASAAKRVANRVRELTQYLVDDLGVDVDATGTGKVTIHQSCHGLRGLGLGEQAEKLVDSVAGVERCELPGADECCGFGGLFSIELPEVSSAILETKIENIVSTGAETVVGGDVSCLMHISGGIHRRGLPIDVKHVVELLGDEG